MKKKLESFIDKAIELLDIVIVKINLLKTLISFHLGRNSEIGENKRFSLTHFSPMSNFYIPSDIISKTYGFFYKFTGNRNSFIRLTHYGPMLLIYTP